MKVLLSIAASAIGAVLALQWWNWPPGDLVRTDQVPPIEQMGDADQSGTLELLSIPLEKEEYVSIVERPLFLPDRRPPKEQADQPPPEEKAPNVELDTMDLTAILITPKESVVWIRSASDKTPEKLRLGEEFEGWTLTAIKSDEIELERQGDRDTIILRDYSKTPPQVARPPRASARQPATKAKRPKPASLNNPAPPRDARKSQTRSNAQRPQ